MQAKVVERLATDMTFAKACYVIETAAALCEGKLADGDRHTAHGRHHGIIEQEMITDDTPQSPGQEVDVAPKPELGELWSFVQKK
jgi:hypothetical protein